MRLNLPTIGTLTLAVLSSFLFIYFLAQEKIHYGGDIIEYYGMTESFMQHGTLELTAQDQETIEERLGPGYLKNPEYYLKGLGGNRFAVHFPLYSIIITPVRFFLNLTGFDSYQVFRLGNLAILSGMLFIILHWYVRNPYKQLLLICMLFLSPLSWFIIWPGPELYSNMLILLSLFMLYKGQIRRAIFVSAIASFQSQPLAVIPFAYAAVYIFVYTNNLKETLIPKIKYISLPVSAIFLPNLYYLIIFQNLTSHGRLGGVGLQNFTFLRLWELYFDLNFGLAIYMPIIFTIGIIGIISRIRNTKKELWIAGLLAILSIFYLTNNNWNSGTAGYGPIRYALPTIPFLIFFALDYLQNPRTLIPILGIIFMTQIPIFWLNGGYMPTLENDKRLTPIARYVMTQWPWVYNPTPEIFLERVAEREGLPYDTVIFLSQGICKKAYVVNNNYQPVLNICSAIPRKYLDLMRSGRENGYYINF